MIYNFDIYKVGDIAYAISRSHDSFIIGFVVGSDEAQGITFLYRTNLYPSEYDAMSDLISWVRFYKNHISEEGFGPDDLYELSNAVLVVKDKPIDIQEYRYIHHDEVKP